MSLTWEIHSSLQEIANLEKQWRELHRNSISQSIYNGFDFIFQSVRHFHYPTVTPYILTIHYQQNLIGLFFLQSDTEKRMGLNVRVIEFCGLEEIDKPTPVIHQHHQERAWNGFFQYLRENKHWDIVNFIEQQPENILRLKGLSQDHKMIRRVNEDKSGPILNLNKDWDEYWQSHRKMRKKLYRIEKEFNHEFEFKVGTGIELLNDYISIEKSSWKRGKLGITKSPNTHDFYLEMANNLKQDFYVGILYIQGEPVSGEIAYHCNGTVYFCHGCYAETFSRYSPGMISTSLFLKYFMQRDTFHHGDFLCGYAGYLNAWSDETVKTQRIDIYRPNWITGTFFALRAINKITPSFIKRFAKVTHALLKNNS